MREAQLENSKTNEVLSEIGDVQQNVPISVQSLKQGDDRAWKAFLGEHEQAFFRCRVQRWGENAEKAKDAVYEALHSAIKKLEDGAFDSTGIPHLQNYIYSLLKLRSSVSRHQRSESSIDELDSNQLAAHGDAVSEIADRDDIRWLESAIDERLNANEAGVVRLAYLRHPPLSNREIAAETGQPYGQVCALKKRGLDKLREIVAAQGAKLAR